MPASIPIYIGVLHLYQSTGYKVLIYDAQHAQRSLSSCSAPLMCNPVPSLVSAKMLLVLKAARYESAMFHGAARNTALYSICRAISLMTQLHSKLKALRKLVSNVPSLKEDSLWLVD